MYVMPSRRTITRKLTEEIDKLKMQRRKTLKESMDGGNIIHSVMDLWSSRAMEPIAGIRFQYFDNAIKLNVVLATYRHFGEQHTGENIAAVFEETLAAYDIPMKAAGYQVTDHAKNMIKAFSLFFLETIIGVCKTVVIFARFDSYYVN